MTPSRIDATAPSSALSVVVEPVAEHDESPFRHNNTMSSNNSRSSPRTPTSSSGSGSGSGLPLNFHVLLSGWTKLEAVQRWVLERTLEYIPHPHYRQNSSMVQRVLKDAELEELRVRYKEQIKADAEIQALQKQIRTMRQQLQQERRERERLEKKHVALRERDQKALDAQRLKLKQALDSTTAATAAATTTNSKSNHYYKRDYGKALQRAGNRKQRKTPAGGSSSSGGSSLYSKYISQPITYAITTTISSSNNNSASSKTDKEALALETTILRNLHLTMAYDNQCHVAQTYEAEILSALKRARSRIDQDNAQIAMFSMVLDGTSHALAGLYPEIISKQEGLILRIVLQQQQQQQQQHYKLQQSSSSQTSIQSQSQSHSQQGGIRRRSIPRVIVPVSVAVAQFNQQRNNNNRNNNNNTTTTTKRYSFSSSNNPSSVSDLGESVETNSTKDSGDSVVQLPPSRRGRQHPVFTSAEALQKQTLQHLAGVRGM